MYEWLKAVHVACVLLFSGGLVGLLIASTAIGARGPDAEDQGAGLRTAVQNWDRRITQPALAGVWGFGIWVAVSGGWFSEPWLQVKLVFVLVLSGLHGALAGRLRRVNLQATPTRGTAPSLTVAATVLVSFAVIAVLAVVKPF